MKNQVFNNIRRAQLAFWDAIKALSFEEVVSWYVHERGITQPTPEWVIWFQSLGSGTLNTGSGISVVPCKKEDANVGILIHSNSYEFRVAGVVTPAREFIGKKGDGYAVGHGHYNSSTITSVIVGESLPEHLRGMLEKFELI